MCSLIPPDRPLPPAPAPRGAGTADPRVETAHTPRLSQLSRGNQGRQKVAVQEICYTAGLAQGELLLLGEKEEGRGQGDRVAAGA